MFNFKINQEYFREEVLEFVGSHQKQSGIIWGPKNINCVIVTSGGSYGKQSGYEDSKKDDGTWDYIGQGSKGDQKPYSYANALLTKQDKNVLLFSTKEPTSKEVKERGSRKKRYKFEGIFDVLSWEIIEVPKGNRQGDKLVVCHLIPANNIYNDFEVESTNLPGVITTLAEMAIKYKAHLETKKQLQKKPDKERAIQYYKDRSKLVKDYALLRADGICELCDKPAPFITEKGAPFLEVHHIFRLADDGPDEPKNVAALCPNCHREAHLGKNTELLKAKLYEKIDLKNNEILPI